MKWLYLILPAWCLGCAASPVDTLEYRSACISESMCPTGSSCLDGLCTRDGTRPLASICDQDSQCASGLFCQNGVCQPGCGGLYDTQNCPKGSYCGFDKTSNALTCISSSCDIETCNDTCVDLDNETSICMKSCSVIFQGTTPLDPCNAGTRCDLLPHHTQSFCLTSPTAQHMLDVDQPGCDPSHPCVQGNVCMQGICRSWCDPRKNNTCPSTHTCAIGTGGHHNISVCLPW